MTIIYYSSFAILLPLSYPVLTLFLSPEKYRIRVNNLLFSFSLATDATLSLKATKVLMKVSVTPTQLFYQISLAP